MDLLTTVRKEGSRGGRGDFKWSDVQGSTHRENYLGHSLMAPVGRWQKGRDLNWYAKGDTAAREGEDAVEKAARERREEIKRVKEAEQDALARALGFEVAPRNPNLEELGDKREVDRVLKEAVEDEGGQGGKGVGFGGFNGGGPRDDLGDEDRIEGTAEKQDAELSHALREYRRRHGEAKERRRSRSRSRSREHRKHHHRRHGRDTKPGDRRRSRSRDHKRKQEREPERERSKSRDRRPRGDDDRNRGAGRGGRDQARSRSPYDRRDEREGCRRRDEYGRRRG